MLLAPVMLMMFLQSADPAGDTSFVHSARIEQRIVKTFDFDERALGNFEDVPMNWLRITHPGYPRFLEAVFDEKIGHAAPPSFMLKLQTGSLGSFYRAKDIPVHPRSHYRVTAWVRPGNLKRARALISAYYLDHAFQKIEASERRSRLVQGPDGEWQEVAVELPSGFKTARWIGLSCRVEQAPEAEGGRLPYHEIKPHDVHGRAWFDDISVMRLPRIGFALDKPHHVYRHDEPTLCTIDLADIDGSQLTIELATLDASGRVMRSETLNPETLIKAPVTKEWTGLPAGQYTLRLTTRIGERVVGSRDLTFLRLNPDLGAQSDDGFGIVADQDLFTRPAISEKLVRLLTPNRIKIPLWHHGLRDRDLVVGDPARLALVDALHKMGLTLVGVIDSAPDSLVSDSPESSLWSVLSSDSAAWRADLALILTRHGQRVRAWQVGADSNPGPPNERMLRAGVDQIQAELTTLVPGATLALPQHVHDAFPRVLDGRGILQSITIPDYYAADRLEQQLGGSSTGASQRRWATLELPARDRYERVSKLTSFARRLVTARFGGVEDVFVPQPWNLLDDGTVEPFEEFIFLRTVNQVLAGMKPVGAATLGFGGRSWLYADATDTEGALVVWVDAAPGETRAVVLDVGDSAVQIDMWGNVSSPRVTPRGGAYELGAMPVLIRPVDPARIRMLASFAIDDPSVTASVKYHERQITLTNTKDERMVGSLELDGPPRWGIRPSRLDVDLAAGESMRRTVTINVPRNQHAETYWLRGKLAANAGAEVNLGTPIRVTSPALDVKVMSYRDGAGLRVFQRVTNRTSLALDLRAYLLSPVHGREYRSIKSLAAGQTAVREYAIPDVKAIAGKPLRVSVEEIGGTIRHHDVIEVK